MILVVHTTNLSRRPHLVKARSCVPRLALLQDGPTWERAFADRVADVDTRDLDACVSAAERLHEAEPIEGVVAFVEHSVLAAATVAAHLGLPGPGVHTATLARDKYLMRRAMDVTGVPCPRYALASTAEEALDIAVAFGYPVVLKPVIGGGSQYVRRVDTPAEVIAHFPAIQAGAWVTYDYDPMCAPSRASYHDAILVESYIPGGEASVESLIVDGETEILAVHDKPMPMTGPFFDEIYYSTPSRLAPHIVARLHELTRRVHEAIGLRAGATHAEFRITREGNPVALEVAARIGGGAVYHSVLHSVGVDMVEAVIDLARGRRPRLARHEPRPTGEFSLLADEEGILEGVDGLNDARADPHVLEIAIYNQVGSEILTPPRAFQAHGHILATADTMSELDHVIERLADSLRFRVCPAPVDKCVGALKPAPAARSSMTPASLRRTDQIRRPVTKPMSANSAQ